MSWFFPLLNLEMVKCPGDANDDDDDEPGVQKTERCESGNGHQSG
jgi:hypothetical protein